VNDRVQRARESGVDVLTGVVSDAVAALDRAVADDALRILGPDGTDVYRTFIEFISQRAVDALSERELVAAFWMTPDLVALKWKPPGPPRDRRAPTDDVRLVDAMRASLEAAVAYALIEHVRGRLQSVCERRAA
jgi:hypothetical protein